LSSTAIKIENLSKMYRLGTIGTGTLSHDLKRWWTMNIMGREDPYIKISETNTLDLSNELGKNMSGTQNNKAATSSYIWALKDINLEIDKGDVVGIIGKNGAGKSTLLKILSRVTKPTIGTISYKGRIASLLEVGTGFHFEMTGRENIYMNGAIMGMTRAEITHKLNEIIDFAGVERYIDTPVKRYSSGMIVRLGFSIAAHLEPDILVVDEVLAVGDSEFQKKAIGKMQDVSKGSGRTVLFVSHNLQAISSLCNRAVLLNKGSIIATGNCDKVVSIYSQANKISNGSIQSEIGDSVVNLLSCKLLNTKGDIIETVKTNEDNSVEIEYEILRNGFTPRLSIHLIGSNGETILCSIDNSESHYSIGKYTKKMFFPKYFFNEMQYSIGVAASTFTPHLLHFFERDIIIFNAIDDLYNSNKSGFTGKVAGYIRPNFLWKNLKN
jgi:lipopolysaccharide transport system ATP-binding protein